MHKSRTLSLMVILLLAPLSAGSAAAHHSMQLYDKDQLVTVEGIVSYAKFGNPHSRFELNVTKDGQSQAWVMIAQDPRDARRFGYFDELKAIEVGQKLKLVGWPHKRNTREMLGQQMITPGGKIVELIPVSGYVRPQLYQIMDWAVKDPEVRSHVIADDAQVTGGKRLLAWVQNDHSIARAATEVQLGRAKLIATTLLGLADYHGMPKYLRCQADDGYGVTYSKSDFMSASQTDLDATVNWLKTYNRVLAKHWELDRESCGQ